MAGSYTKAKRSEVTGKVSTSTSIHLRTRPRCYIESEAGSKKQYCNESGERLTHEGRVYSDIEKNKNLAGYLAVLCTVQRRKRSGFQSAPYELP